MNRALIPHPTGGVAGCAAFLRSFRRIIVEKPSNETKDTAPSSPMINQCDGCRAGYPTFTLAEIFVHCHSNSVLHRYPDGTVMGCEKYRYHKPGELKDEVEEILDKLPKV
jgi:hypothetical protein